MAKSVEEIVADKNTPEWIKLAVARLRKREPSYAALLEALHDLRVGA